MLKATQIKTYKQNRTAEHNPIKNHIEYTEYLSDSQLTASIAHIQRVYDSLILAASTHYYRLQTA